MSSCLTFLTGEVALWATLIIDQLNNAGTPFPSWNDFVAAFRARFETVDMAGDAFVALDNLYQGTKTAAEYTALFKQYVERTGLSDEDLRKRYCKHLTSYLKDWLADSERDQSTLQ